MTRLADGLLALATPEARSAFSSMISRWAQVDAPRAGDWMLANMARVPVDSLRNVAQQLVRADAERAMRMADQVPAAARANWIVGVAGGLAQNDLAGATRWIDRFRGQPGYDAALTAVVQQAAQNDPAGASRLLTNAGSAVQAQAAPQLVARWVQQDPPAAARWTETIADAPARSGSMNAAARSWAQRDANAAERWARALPSQVDRDGALSGVFAGAAASGSADPRILDAIGSDELRQRAAMNAIGTLARSDAAAARRLLTNYVTDFRMRQQAEQMLAQATGQVSGVPIFIN
jgi:hypothetical protein